MLVVRIPSQSCYVEVEEDTLDSQFWFEIIHLIKYELNSIELNMLLQNCQKPFRVKLNDDFIIMSDVFNFFNWF